MRRGYFGIGIYNPKTIENLGTLFRSAHNFGADFIFTVGHRYKKQPSDTTKAWKHIPFYEYTDMEHFRESIPKDCQRVAVEQTIGSKSLKNYIHPERAVYLLGAEDVGIPIEYHHWFSYGGGIVHIDTPMCLNVAVAGSIVMYDRQIKSK